MIPTGISAIDSLTGGIPRGCLTEICGPASSGRTSVLLALMAECMRRDEICALVDASDAFDPQSADSAAVDLARLLWVRCKQSGERIMGGLGEVKSQKSPARRVSRFDSSDQRSPQQATELQLRLRGWDQPVTGSPRGRIARSAELDEKKESKQLEQALKASDLLLHAGGFGLVILDLADISVPGARRIPLTTWFRFRRAVEDTSTAFLVVEQQPNAKSCASLVLDFAVQQAAWSEAAEAEETILGTHFDGTGAPVSGFSTTDGRDGVSFRVTAQGVAIPFNKPVASSFEIPQRWITPRARLLSTTHVHLQVTRSRGISGSKKLPGRSELVSPGADARGVPIAAHALPQ